jgi:L-asparaginase II
MRAHPFLVGGTGRDVTALMQQVDGLVVKDGAEGVCAAATAGGVGVALKIDDGGGRARSPVLVEALRRLGATAIDAKSVANVTVLGHGEPVGVVRAVF